MRRMLLAVGLLLAVSLLCGCSSAVPRSADEPQAAKVVAMGFHSFNPPEVTITVGQTIEWQNDSIIWHTVTCDPSLAKRPQDVVLPQGAQSFNSGQVDPGHRYYHLFTVPGTYRYFCEPHELSGMIGEVIVTAAAERSRTSGK